MSYSYPIKKSDIRYYIVSNLHNLLQNDEFLEKVAQKMTNFEHFQLMEDDGYDNYFD